MKKLTKTLSLVLVVAMVLGLCVIGAGATFTDNDKITKDYTEATAIMTDMKVVGGYTDGSFKPAGTLTRAEAAVMLTNMTLGANAKAVAPSTVSFKDVPASFWGYKYVEYCYQSGYIAGTGSGKFSPNATLTGYQWALMLMRVRGVDLTNMTGANWQINTAKAYYADGTKFSDVTIGATAVTREAATQMTYDALFTSLSGATGYPVIRKADSVVMGVYSTVAEAVAMQTVLGGNTLYDVGATKVTMGTDYMAKTVFGVTKGTSTVNTFGRPSNTYTATTLAQATAYGWNTTTKAKVVSNAPILTYTTPVTLGKLYSDLGGYATAIPATVNSIVAQTTNTTVTPAAGSAVLVANTGFGVLTEVYKTSSTPTYSVVQIVPTFGALTIGSTSASTTHGAYKTYTVGGKSGVVYSTVVDKTADVNTAVVTGTLATGDMALAYQDSKGVVYISAVNSTAGVLSAKSSTGVLTIGGTANQIATGVAGATAVNAYTISTVEQSFYTDANGYVLGSATAAAGAKYGFVLKAYQGYTTNNNVLTAVNMAYIALPDGTVANVPTSNVYTALTAGTAYTYGISAKGVYTLTAIDGTAIDGTAGTTRMMTTGTKITAKAPTIATSNAVVNDNTKFIFANYTDGVANGTVTVFTGKDNVPTYTTACTSIDISKTADGIADVVYVYANVMAGSTTQYAYVVGTYNETATGYVYDTIVDGKASTVTVSYAGLTAKTLYTKIVDDGTGLSTALDSSVKASTLADTAKYASIQYIGGILKLTDSVTPTAGTSTVACAGTVPVYTFAADGSVSTSAASDLVTAVTGKTTILSYAADGTTITGIYIY